MRHGRHGEDRHGQARLSEARRGMDRHGRQDRARIGRVRPGKAGQSLNMEIKMDKLQKELETIRKRGGGILKAEDVVSFAQNPKTALHSKFTWDDTEAAKQYRLWQAREVIRVCVTVRSESKDAIRTYVSIAEDRYSGGGYRHIEDVLSNYDLHTQMLRDVLSEFRRVQMKHNRYTELQPIYDAIDEVDKRFPLAAIA